MGLAYIRKIWAPNRRPNYPLLRAKLYIRCFFIAYPPCYPTQCTRTARSGDKPIHSVSSIFCANGGALANLLIWFIYPKRWNSEEENCIQNGMALPPQSGHLCHSCQWQMLIDDTSKRMAWGKSGFLDICQYLRLQVSWIKLEPQPPDFQWRIENVVFCRQGPGFPDSRIKRSRKHPSPQPWSYHASSNCKGYPYFPVLYSNFSRVISTPER